MEERKKLERITVNHPIIVNPPVVTMTLSFITTDPETFRCAMCFWKSGLNETNGASLINARFKGVNGMFWLGLFIILILEIFHLRDTLL